MNNYELQIFVDSDTALMIQAFSDSGVSIDFGKVRISGEILLG